MRYMASKASPVFSLEPAHPWISNVLPNATLIGLAAEFVLGTGRPLTMSTLPAQTNGMLVGMFALCHSTSSFPAAKRKRSSGDSANAISASDEYESSPPPEKRKRVIFSCHVFSTTRDLSPNPFICTQLIPNH